MLTLSIAFERFQSIARRGRQVTQFSGDVQLSKFPLCYSLEISKPLEGLPRMELLPLAKRLPAPPRDRAGLFCLLRPEGFDHGLEHVPSDV